MLERRIGRCLRGVVGLAHFREGLVAIGRERVALCAGAFQQRRRAGDRVVAPALLDLLLRAIERRVGAGVAGEAIGVEMQEARAAVLAHGADRLARGKIDR